MKIVVMGGSFNPSILDHFKLMTERLTAKFGQNVELQELLLSTGDAILLEASPYGRMGHWYRLRRGDGWWYMAVEG